MTQKYHLLKSSQFSL